MKVLLLLVLACTWLFVCAVKGRNNRPIIGVIAEELDPKKPSKYGTSFIAASYVKFLEFAGARVAPIMIYQPLEYYVRMLSQINGVLFPGGGVPLTSDGYGRTAKIIFDLAVKLNENNDYFPLWGSCLGFEFLNYVVAQKLWMKTCSQIDTIQPINLAYDYKKSKMFKDLEPNARSIMERYNVTYHHHQWCLSPENYTISGLDKYFRVLALNRDADNSTFISVVEAYKYPFYGVSFHAEKVLFEWMTSKSYKNIPHDYNAVKTSQYFANFFANEARKNFHKFQSKSVEENALVYNFAPVFTGKFNSSFEQKYFFNVTKP